MLDSKRKLRILQVDTFSTPTAWANTQGLAAAYRRVGELYTYDYRAKVHEVKAPWSRPDIWGKPKWKELVKEGLTGMRTDLLELASWYKPDLIHLGKCEYLDGQTVKAIKKKTGAFIVHYYGDFWHEVKPWVAGIGKHADWTLLCHQDAEIVNRHKDAGCKQVGFWQAGTDLAVYRPCDVSVQDYDVVFLGRPIQNTGLERSTLLQALACLDLNVHVFGGNWQAIDGLRGIQCHPFTDGDGFAWACSRAKVALSINANVTMYTSWRRIFNTMASGAFLLVKYFPGIDTVFTNHKHLVWFGDKAEAVEQVWHYIKNEDKRREIAAQGCELVRQNHTWDHRVSEILNLLEGA